jgi:N-methylhydantoinase A
VCVAVDDRVFRGKALTDYEDFGRGVVTAIGVAAQNGGVEISQLLSQTKLLINGTTVVTNAITEGRGARVGVLVTTGFKDTFRFSGGPRLAEFDDHQQLNPPELVRRHDIKEIDERVDFAGNVLAPLDAEQTARAVQELVDAGVSAIAVCFLSSYANPEHELQAAEIIRGLAPEIFVTLSHRVFAARGENRRWTTAVLNSFVHERARRYLNSMDVQLRDAGLAGGLAFFQGLGGGISAERVGEHPLVLLGSGPAGGAIGANELARRMGRSRVLVGDMGGTSFDTGIISGNEIHIEQNLELGQLETGVNLVDVISVGAGGGSIAWIDERGVSHPGPACYGLGGTRPTVTDAMVCMGFIDPDRYLGGRFEIRPELGRSAIEEQVGKPFGWTAEEASAAIHDLVVVNMATAVREVTVNKGYDPRDFMFLAYGGTLPLFAAHIAERLGIDTVVIPQNSSVFCAQGLLSADFVQRYDRAVSWDLDRGDGVDGVNAAIDELRELGRSEMRADGFVDDDISVTTTADFRFRGQYYELAMPIPDRPLEAADAPDLADAFLALYERTYGAGTAWKGVPAQLLNVTITATGRRERHEVPTVPAQPRDAVEIRRATRRVFLPEAREWADTPIYDDAAFTSGSTVAGPAVIDVSDTTVYVPDGVTASRDEYLNYVLTH